MVQVILAHFLKHLYLAISGNIWKCQAFPDIARYCQIQKKPLAMAVLANGKGPEQSTERRGF